MSGADLLVLPLLLPLAGAILSAFVSPGRGAWGACLFSALTLAASGVLLYHAYVFGPLSFRLGGWPVPYGIVLVADLLGASLATLSAAVATAAALHTLLAGGGVPRQPFYHPFFLLLLTALGGVFLTGDLFNLYVFMELVILSSFPLVALAERRVAAEATFKYAVLSALGSTLLLVSVALVYAQFGTLNLADIAVRGEQGVDAPFATVTAALLLFVFLLKAAVFPFHFWQPDAHSAAPAAVSAMLSGVLVKVGVYGIIRMETLLFPDASVLLLLTPVGAAAALFGGFAALANPDLKRLLAYSTISNMGFIVLALGWGTQLGMIAALVNLVNHALIKASLFLTGGHVAEGLQEHELERLGGVAGLAPAAAVAFGIGAVALAGLPPTSGLFSKLTLLEAGVEHGGRLILLAVLLASALGIAYPARAFVGVFWGEPSEAVRERWRAGTFGAGTLGAALLLAGGYLLLGAWPAPLLELARATAAELADRQIYIAAVLNTAP